MFVNDQVALNVMAAVVTAAAMVVVITRVVEAAANKVAAETKTVQIANNLVAAVVLVDNKAKAIRTVHNITKIAAADLITAVLKAISKEIVNNKANGTKDHAKINTNALSLKLLQLRNHLFLKPSNLNQLAA